VIEKILARPVSVIVATIAFAALGAFALLKLPLALLPQIERPSLVVTAKAPAVSRDQLIHDVTAPIERRLALVPGVTSVESETRDGEARVTIGSAWQTDADRLRIDVTRRIEGAAGVPLDELSVETTTDLAPVIEVAVMGGSGGTRSRIADRVVLPELARVDGAGRIDVVGATPLRVVVRPRAADLAARGITAADVERRLRTIGRSLTAGRVREGAAVRPVVVVEPLHSVDELRAIVILSREDGEGSPDAQRGSFAALRMTEGGVPLGEVADVGLQEVSDGTVFWSAARERRFQSGGSAAALQGVLLRVYRAPNANAVALARGVRARVAELAPRMRDIRLSVVVDRSGDVSRALVELALAALLGVLLGTLILRWMIGHWRPTLALAIVIPAALLASFTAFYAAGIPLDVISLSGLALATGLLVDNSIVVLESIDTAGSVLAGTRQIIVAVVASSITLMIVFAPLLYLRGLARAIFGEQAIAVVVSVAASLVLSLTLTPVLASARSGRLKPAATPGIERYLRVLDGAMARPTRALVVGAAVVAVGLSLGLLLRRELFARGAARDVVVEVDPAMASTVRGPSMWMMQLAEDEPAVINMQFADERAARAAVDRVNGRLRPSAFIEAVGGQADRVELIPSAATDAEAEQLARRVIEAMRRNRFRQRDESRERRLAMWLRWDEERLAANGTTRAAIEGDVRAALGNFDAGDAQVAAAEPEIRLLPTTPENLGVVPVRVGNDIVPLGAVAGVRLAPRSPVVFRDERRPARRLVFEGNDVAAAERAIAAVAPRGSERIRVAGHARELRDAFAQMRLALMLAVVLLYLTVAAFYESLLLPLPVIAALPFAAAGAFVALVLTGQTLNIMSLLGLIFLGGVVVNHTVVLLDRAEHLRASGVPEDEAIRRAAADRYRPVIMTTITAIAGMLPLALFGGPGVELRRSIAVVVIGGLATATVGTLVLIPLLHRALEPFRRHA
jgi:HAE1 family hydrophobic/amphiphilic exporter-1